MRPSWEDYWMMFAKQVSNRASCINRAVGCVIVKDNNVLSIGYNGAIAGHEHCTDTGLCHRDNYLLPAQRELACVAVHAEANAVLRAKQREVSLEGATAYITMSPCKDCFTLLAKAGIKHTYYELLHHENNPDPVVPMLFRGSKMETYAPLVIKLNSGIDMKRCISYPTSRKRNKNAYSK